MTTKEIADALSIELVGDPDIEITGIASIASAESGDLAFALTTELPETSASAVIVPLDSLPAEGLTILRAKAPKLEFARAGNLLKTTAELLGRDETSSISNASDVRAEYIGPFASIGANSSVADGCRIHAGVRIGDAVVIGEGTIIYPNCVIYDGVKIGANCVIHAGTVIGSDGFGYVKTAAGEHLQFPQVGTLTIENNVEIGANCTIDRGSLGETLVGEGTKIDNLVHIAHNVQIGKRVLIAGQSGIAGSSVIEDDVVIAGQVGISDHVTIKAGAVIGAKSSVFPNKIIRAGFWVGNPVRRHADYVKETTLIRGLKGLSDAVRKLEDAAMKHPE